MTRREELWWVGRRVMMRKALWWEFRSYDKREESFDNRERVVMRGDELWWEAGITIRGVELWWEGGFVTRGKVYSQILSLCNKFSYLIYFLTFSGVLGCRSSRSAWQIKENQNWTPSEDLSPQASDRGHRDTREWSNKGGKSCQQWLLGETPVTRLSVEPEWWFVEG